MTPAPVASTPLSHWRTWVVPAVPLRAFIYDHQHIWQARYVPPQGNNMLADLDPSKAGHRSSISVNNDCGWRTYLSMEISMQTRRSFDAAARHLYRVMSLESRCIHAEFADAVVMSVDLDIDRDTTIPVLPGNLRNARELLEVRDPDFNSRTKAEQMHYQREVMELCMEIIKHPERQSELQDAAPFNCLRPAR